VQILSSKKIHFGFAGRTGKFTGSFLHFFPADILIPTLFDYHHKNLFCTYFSKAEKASEQKKREENQDPY
jgi:hypothetical protein